MQFCNSIAKLHKILLEIRQNEQKKRLFKYFCNLGYLLGEVRHILHHFHRFVQLCQTLSLPFFFRQECFVEIVVEFKFEIVCVVGFSEQGFFPPCFLEVTIASSSSPNSSASNPNVTALRVRIVRSCSESSSFIKAERIRGRNASTRDNGFGVPLSRADRRKMSMSLVFMAYCIVRV